MTNKEKYKRTFSALHASGHFLEVKPMKTAKTTRIPRLVAACTAIIVLFSLSCVAYAADIGGIQRNIQLWLHGEQTDAVLEIQNGTYTLSYEDSDGQTHIREGGGISIDAWGNEQPITEEDILEHLNAPEVSYEEDGSVWVYYYGQEIEITDLFDEDGVCYVQLKNDSEIIYVTVKFKGGFAYSTKKFPDPDSFSIGK